MSESNKPDKYQPMLLLPNVSYPTYQLYAEAGNGKSSPDIVLRIAILTTFSWLRQRFRAFEVPDELRTPEASDYENVDINEFKTFSLSKGYKVEVVWLLEERAWTLQLVEPDLGSDPGMKEQKRYPVPGRLFETNIAYQIKGDKVICGFKTIVSDPINTETKAEVFRLAIIKRLVRHKLVGLKHYWPMAEHAHMLDKKSAIEQLASFLREKNRLLPAVIAAACPTEKTAEAPFSSLEHKQGLDPLILQMTQASRIHEALPLMSDGFRQDQINRSNEITSGDVEPGYTINIDDLARHKVGFAIFFKLPLEQLERFNKISKLGVRPGEILLCEPPFVNDNCMRFAPVSLKTDSDLLYQNLGKIIDAYPRSKEMDFESTLFLSDAKLRFQEMIISLSSSKEEIIHAHRDLIERMDQKHKDDISALRDKLIIAADKYRRQQEVISEYNTLRKDHEDELADIRLHYEKRLEQKEKEIERLKMRRQSPLCLADVDKWVKEHFFDRLIIHSRARDMLRDVQDSEVDLSLICDALEYLAFEYRDCLLGKIDEHERNNICSQIYNRPFDVTYINDETIEKYPREYKIKYYRGSNGQLIDSPINLHLRVGNKNENLLRIYFLYDKDKRLIVVGSLPKHLKTTSYH